MIKHVFFISVSFICGVLPAFGQFKGNNLLEFQLGNLPEEDPADLTTHYDQLNLSYRYKSLKASVRYEHFFSQNQTSSYNKLTQYQLQYRNKGLDIQVGNFNAIIGNGLLLRAYEIPGSVFEEEGYRSRYGFYRDIRGFFGQYRWSWGYVKALRGNSLTNTLPPLIDDTERRNDLAEAAETGINLFGQSAGIALLRNSNSGNQSLFYSLMAKGNIIGFLSYNLEYVHDLAAEIPWFSPDESTRYGFYSSLNFSSGAFGISAEFKDYHDLLIGSGISDPPTLIREHKYKVLNRSIHVPQYFDESGVQIEAYYTFNSGARLLLNYARAENEFASLFVFNEYFAEYSFNPWKAASITLFADYANDAFKGEDHRYAVGSHADFSLKGFWSALLQLEYQYIERSLVGNQFINNVVVTAGISKSSRTTLSITAEVSDDPELIRNGDPRLWLGGNFSYKINNTNTFSLFAGQRRGGPACTSGICYEVLDFEGLEIRFTSKF